MSSKLFSWKFSQWKRMTDETTIVCETQNSVAVARLWNMLQSVLKSLEYVHVHEIVPYGLI